MATNYHRRKSRKRNGVRLNLKCMCKQARYNKAKFEHERAVEREKVRWDSLTPEEQKKEPVKKAKKEKRTRKMVFTLGSFVSAFSNSYNKFRL